MEISTRNDFLLAQMPERIRQLAIVDLPKLAKHKKEWKRFLWQRGLELDHQWKNSTTGQEFHAKISKFIDMLTDKDGCSDAFKEAIKSEAFNIFAHYDGHITPITEKSITKAKTLPPLSPAESFIPPPQSHHSFLSRFATTSLNLANKTDRIYTKARNALFGLTITATYTLYAAAAIDIAVNGADNSYTKRAFENDLSAHQNTLKP